MILELRYDMRRLNRDIENFNETYRKIRDDAVQPNAGQVNISSRLEGLLVEKDILMNGFQECQTNCVRLLAYSRIRRAKDLTPMMHFRQWLIQRKITPINEKEINEGVKEHLAAIRAKQRK